MGLACSVLEQNRWLKKSTCSVDQLRKNADAKLPGRTKQRLPAAQSDNIIMPHEGMEESFCSSFGSG